MLARRTLQSGKELVAMVASTCCQLSRAARLDGSREETTIVGERLLFGAMQRYDGEYGRVVILNVVAAATIPSAPSLAL